MAARSPKKVDRGLPLGEGARPLVVAVLDGRKPPLGAAAEARRLGADALELRIDGLPPGSRGPAEVASLIRRVKAAARLSVIATYRLPSEGGLIAPDEMPSERERGDVLAAAAGMADLVDVELGAPLTARRAIEAAHAAKGLAILSHHDMTGTPGRAALAGLARRAEGMGGDVLKIAALARSKEDAARLLEFCRTCRFPRKVVIAMGSVGTITRVAGFLFGSALTYGFLEESVAPGQLSLRELVTQVRRYYP